MESLMSKDKIYADPVRLPDPTVNPRLKRKPPQSLPPTLAELFQIKPSGLQFTFKAVLLPETTFNVVSFNFIERYNDLFELDLHLSSIDANISFGTMLDNPATLYIWQDAQLQRAISGIVTHFEAGDSGFQQTFYRLRLSPHLWRLSLKRNSRIFQLTDIQDILKKLLKEGQVPFSDFLFSDSHPRREFCVQYRETDYEFLQRLCAEEGIFFFFRQRDNSIEEVIFCDNAELLKTTELTLPYNVNRNALLQEKCVTTFRRSEQIRPTEAVLKDYTFKNPHWRAEFNREAEDSDYQRMIYPHYDYPGRYKDDTHGKAFTRYRLDALRHDAHLGTGESNSIQLAVGTLLKLENHPRHQFNDRWQLVRISHHGEQPQSVEREAGIKGTYLTNRFEFIPHFQTYRANLPQKPRIEGTQTAVVVGPPGEEIYCDNFGRVRVQFHWDRLGKNDDHSSCWIQVAQPWAGEGWGMLAIPRVGQEVVVSFQEGDPDQPIIIGRMYNATHLPPGNLPISKTQMHIRSKTYKKWGHNSIMFDDATNDELFAMHAEKDMDTVVENDQRYTIKHNRSVLVENNQSYKINNSRTVDVKKSQSTTIGTGRTTTILTGDDIRSVLLGSDIRNIQLASIKNIAVGDNIRNILLGNDVAHIKSGDLIEKVHNARLSEAKEMSDFAEERLELKVGPQTSITLDNEKILLAFGTSTVLLDKDGVWLDGVHVGLHERVQNNVQFHMVDDDEVPYAHTKFTAQLPDGKEIKGITDKDGFTPIFINQTAGKVKLQLDLEDNEEEEK